MPSPLDRDTRRQLRLLEALHARQLHEVYPLNPEVRRDLALEAAFGAEHPDDALLSPELFVDLRKISARLLKKGRGRRAFGGPPSAPLNCQSAPSRTFTEELGASNGTVLIVPGGLASSLVDRGTGHQGLIWVNGIALTAGRFHDLKLAPYAGPKREFDLRHPRVKVAAEGTVGMLYDLLSAALWVAGWTPVVAAYDWRKDMDHPSVVGCLKDTIKRLGSENPVHIVTHSQGGIVARRALQKLACEEGCSAAKSLVGEVIMLGPANYGAFVGALAVAGDLREVPLIGKMPKTSDPVQDVLATFTALYQLMPWNDCLAPSLKMEEGDIRRPKFWRAFTAGAIDPDRLDRAFPSAGDDSWAGHIDTKCFDGQITIILGSRPFKSTPGGVQIVGGEMQIDHDRDGHGDGWVLDELAKLDGVKKTYRARNIGHIWLPMGAKVIRAILAILAGDDVKLPEA